MTAVNGDPNPYGVVALDSATGALLPWAVNPDGQERDVDIGGPVSDDRRHGCLRRGGYTYDKGTLEGVFRADPATGAIQWVEDCHGDAYGVSAGSNVVYQRSG